jgi:membrane protein DedA with SNARE-associated domain
MAETAVGWAETAADLWQSLLGAIADGGYGGIFLLMAIESSFIPFPSEAVMIPAGVHIAKGEFHWLPVIVCAIAGSLAGALVNYFLAQRAGRAFLLRYGKYILISEGKLDKAEAFFEKHGEIATLSCRLLPGIRQIVSIPAGLANMNLFRFCIYTSVGAGFWSVILLFIGYAAGEDAEKRNALLTQAGLACAGLAVLLVIWHMIGARASLPSPPPHEE